MRGESKRASWSGGSYRDRPRREWTLGQLREGHEFFAFVFAEQPPAPWAEQALPLRPARWNIGTQPTKEPDATSSEAEWTEWLLRERKKQAEARAAAVATLKSEFDFLTYAVGGAAGLGLLVVTVAMFGSAKKK
jgi:hypothetical protein